MQINASSFIFVLMLLTTNLFGNDEFKNKNKLNKAELVEDVKYLKKMLNKGHPGLYWHTSEIEFNKTISQIESSLDSTMTELDFLRTTAKLNDIIKCSHSDIRPSSSFDIYWKDSVKLIPINIMKVQSEYIIYQNLSESNDLKFGSKIISIDDVPIEEIVESLLPYIPSDGNNISRKYYALRRGFYRYYSYFIDSDSDNYKINYENEKGHKSTLRINGITKEIFDRKRKSFEENTTSPISFELLDSLSTAILTIKTFRNDLFEMHHIIYEDFISDCFKQLKYNKTKNLVIDLRDNGGGYSEYAAILYSFLTDKQFEYCQNQIVTTDSIIEGVYYDIPETFKGFPEGILFDGNHYKWTKHSILGVRSFSRHHFSGNIYFIVNGGCSSTTSELASLAKSNNVGIFVGEEVGGCYLGNSGGVLGWFMLPNSKLRVRMAMVKYEIVPTNSTMRTGVIPDLQVNYTIEDLIKGNDLEKDLILKTIVTK